MALTSMFDDHSLQKYRTLLDAEDEAFDALEHACEDGDRSTWEIDVVAWQNALLQKIAYLQSLGLTVPEPADR